MFPYVQGFEEYYRHTDIVRNDSNNSTNLPLGNAEFKNYELDIKNRFKYLAVEFRDFISARNKENAIDGYAVQVFKLVR